MFGNLPRARPSRRQTANAPVTVYGTDWCAQTQMVRRYLDRVGIPYNYRNLETDPAALRQVEWWTGGYASHPTVQIGGDILVEPTIEELESTLMANGLE